MCSCSDDRSQIDGAPIDWGRWAITGDDPEFGGKGNKDTGDDYGPAPGTALADMIDHITELQQPFSVPTTGGTNACTSLI